MCPGLAIFSWDSPIFSEMFSRLIKLNCYKYNYPCAKTVVEIGLKKSTSSHTLIIMLYLHLYPFNYLFSSRASVYNVTMCFKKTTVHLQLKTG